MTQRRRELGRYGVTIVLGLVVDLVVARSLHALGLPLELAAALGAVAGAAFNYVVLGRWAFADPDRTADATRPLRYGVTLAVTAAIRSGAVWAITAALPVGSPPMVILISAAGLSAFANYMLSKHWVFGSQRTPRPNHQSEHDHA